MQRGVSHKSYKKASIKAHLLLQGLIWDDGKDSVLLSQITCSSIPRATRQIPRIFGDICFFTSTIVKYSRQFYPCNHRYQDLFWILDQLDAYKTLENPFPTGGRPLSKGLSQGGGFVVKLEPYLPAKPLGEGRRLSLCPIYLTNIYAKYIWLKYSPNIFGYMPNIIDQIYLFHIHDKWCLSQIKSWFANKSH